ncbi:hypothetical protein AOLI_G00062410 [Acnodon oligacanthus]
MSELWYRGLSMVDSSSRSGKLKRSVWVDALLDVLDSTDAELQTHVPLHLSASGLCPRSSRPCFHGNGSGCCTLFVCSVPLVCMADL